MNTETRKIRAVLTSITLAASAMYADAADFLSFNEASTYSILGTVNSPTVPTPLTLQFFSPLLADTFISIASTDPSVAIVLGGGITIVSGSNSGVVPITAFNLGNSTFTAQFNGFTTSATVSVVNSLPAVPEPSSAALLAMGLSFALALSIRARIIGKRAA